MMLKKFCAGPSCPGYAYAASEIAHPPSCALDPRVKLTFDPKVWRRISTKYRMISRVPDCELEDLESIEAKIRELDPEMYKHFRETFVHSLTAHFLRCSNAAEKLEISEENFEAFRKAGGQSA